MAVSIAKGHDTKLGKATALTAFPTLLGVPRSDSICIRFPALRDVYLELIPWLVAPGCCVKDEASKIAEINISAAARRMWSAEARTELLCFSFMGGTGPNGLDKNAMLRRA